MAKGFALALTCGEPAGCGPDLTVDLWQRREQLGLPPFICLTDPESLQERARLLGRSVPLEECTPEDAAAVFPRALPLLPLKHRFQAVTPGLPQVHTVEGVVESIETAVALVMGGRCRGVVTNPIHKAILTQGGFAHPGHTEFLGALAVAHGFSQASPVMMMVGGGLRCVPITVHVSLKTAIANLNGHLIVDVARIVHAEMGRWFGYPDPRMAIAGLNPHAGEDGLMGTEEASIIAPAIQSLQTSGIDAKGPFAADSLFSEPMRGKFDVFLTMTHDTALIPVKTLAFHDTVNVTLGLGFVRPSPDHGTALDLAGSGKASTASLAAAVKLANQMAETS